MSVLVAVVLADCGLLVADTRWAWTRPGRADGAPIPWDIGGKMCPWSEDPCVGFMAFAGDARWGDECRRQVVAAKPRTFEELEGSFPTEARPGLHSTVLALGPGMGAGPDLASWLREAGAATPTENFRYRSGCARPLVAAVGPGDMPDQETDALLEALAASVHRDPTLGGALRAIGRYVLDAAEGSRYVSTALDVGYWRDGRGQALRMEAVDMVRLDGLDEGTIEGAARAWRKAEVYRKGSAFWKSMLPGGRIYDRVASWFKGRPAP